MSEQVAVFRCDASGQLGSGHVVRCLALADALRAAGWCCAFASAPGTAEAVPALARSGHRLIELADPAREAASLKLALHQGCDLLVVDHYRRDAEFESACRPWASRILVIDDLASRRHDCELLLDPTLGRQAADYAPLAPETCRMLLGPDFALLRPQFLAARPAALKRRTSQHTIRRILVSLGGTDPSNLTGKVLRGIVLSGVEAAIDVVLGGTAPHLEEVRALAAASPLATSVHTAVEDMASVMSNADLAVGAAGTTSWERCALGLPSLMLVIADNQELVAQSLDQAGAAACLGRHETVTEERLAAEVRTLATNPSRLDAMAARAADLCDGRGTQRTMLALLRPAKSKLGNPVTLRLVAAADEAMILAWQRNPATRRYARNRALPTADEHHAWMQARLADPDCMFAVVECAQVPAGVLRLDRKKAAGNTHEVSIFVAPELHRQGLGICTLALARQLLPGAELIAEVLPENEGSAKLFSLAGYRRYDDGLLHCPPQAC
jgi:UDP-2,4-diacetamido-2,4,6-trideoxy-beta-L-altropyranose hydrolase